MCTDGITLVRHDELAQTVCRQLGLPQPARLIGDAVYGRSPGPVWNDYIECGDGGDRTIEECKKSAWLSATRCGHAGDLTVECGAQPRESLGWRVEGARRVPPGAPGSQAACMIRA